MLGELRVVRGTGAEDVGKCGALRRVGDDDEVPVLVVAAGRCLERELEALAQQRRLDGTFQIEPAPNCARGGEHLLRAEHGAEAT
jgi:hypothetical protein